MNFFTRFAAVGLLLCAAAAGQKIWEFDGIGKGTSTEMGQKVNAEFDRLTARKQELESQIAEETRANKAHRQAVLADMHKTAPYIGKADDLSRVSKELDESRKIHSSQSIELSSQLNHDKSDMALMEFAALNANQPIKQSDKILAGYRDELGKIDISLKAATEWRDKVVASIYGSFRLTWPLEKGEVGLLGNIENVKTTPNGVTFQGRSVEWLRKVAEQEQVGTFDTIQHGFIGTIRDGTPDTVTAVRVEHVVDDGIQIVSFRALPDDDISQLMRALHR